MDATHCSRRAAAPQRRRSLRVLRRRTGATALLAVLVTFWWSSTAFAQLDPLLFIKRVPPTVIVIFDTSLRMLEDGNGNFYDPHYYVVADDPAAMLAFPNIAAPTKTYHRVYRNLQNVAAPGNYTADIITATPALWDPATGLNSNSVGDLAFLDPTRYNIARQGLAAAVAENATSPRWGLIKLRQNTPAWRSSPNCDKPVLVGDASQLLYKDTTPCNASAALANYGIYTPSVLTANYLQTVAPAGGGPVIAPAANTADAFATLLAREPNHTLALIPAGLDGPGFVDRPLKFALDDARAAAVAAMTADSAANRTCRNTIVVLVTGGKDSGSAAYTAANNAETTASSFLSVTASGVTKRVPITVIGVKPDAADVASLRAIAANSGGLYRGVSSAFEVTAAVDYAVQQAFARSADFDTSSPSEFTPVSPIVGTVNLKNGRDATGSALPDTDIIASPGGQPLPQRSNFLLTAGFTLPGFDGALRAFRTYKPEVDATKPTGWKFVNDGTRLWPDLDGRPWMAGKARTPLDPDTRNIYTYIPDGSGGGSVVPFTLANAATLASHMGTGATTNAFISNVRAQNIGAVIGSTPAIMDAPSLEPPPDDDYGRPDGGTTFAGVHKDRRSMIFFGANDGMIHAVDARTGYEVWAFIPYNLLPKLKTLRDGQGIDQFDYFVDSSPKVAEVKISGVWKSLLLIGQGPGGTFYQTFDVTEAGMGVDPSLDDLGAVSSMLTKYDAANESILFKWAFPNYNSFDPAYAATFTVTDGTPGGKVRMYGDLKASATFAEKTVGYTWSDPAVGALDADRTVTAVIVGSGYFPDIEASIPNRGAAAPKAGNAMYLLDVDTGALLNNPSGATCPTIAGGSGSGSGCVVIGDVAANGRKNALQADPTAAGVSGTVAVTKAYLGDIDGKYWRFNFTSAGAITVDEMVDTDQPVYASSALLFVGSTDVYMFFATGSDLLASSAPGGTGTFKLYGLKDNSPASGAETKFAQDLTTVTNSSGLATGERPSTSPSVAGDIVFYTTTTESAGAPCADFSANLYALTYAGGAAYDTNGNNKIDNNESPIAKTIAGRATAPFIVDQHLYLGTAGANGARVEAFGDPEDFNNGIGQVGVRILSWREIR